MARRNWRERLGDFWRFLAPTLVALALLVLTLNYPRMALYALIAVAILAPCVLVHEWGHYIVARRYGMQVREFSIGFGKRLLSRRRRGVRWSLKAVPLGGSVEIAGMTVEQLDETLRSEADRQSAGGDSDDEPIDPERSFIRARPLQRAAVIYAGIGMNLALAWIAFTVTSISLAPAHGGWTTYLLLPINGLVMVARLAAVSVQSLVQLVTDWAASDVGSVLALPGMLSQGVADAPSFGIPVWGYLTLTFGLINLSLAVFNFLPLYPLDGYHGLVALIDLVRRQVARIRGVEFQPLTTAQLGWLTKASTYCFAILVVLVVGKDVVRLFG